MFLEMVFRRRTNLRPVNRIKHVVDAQNATAAGTQLNDVMVLAVETPALASTEEVAIGSTVNAIYLKVEVNATSSAALANVYLIVMKSPGGAITTPVANTVGSNDDKRFVFHQEMVMMQQVTNSNPRTLFNGVIVIPRGYRRMGPNDRITLGILAPGVNINVCIQCHYKEFR